MLLNEMLDNIKQKYLDAYLLIENQRYANAIYLCGYCIELALKYAIAKNLNWPQYRVDGKLKFLKIHDLDILVALSGREVKIKQRSSWSTAIKWDESRRYEDPSRATQQDAQEMLDAAKDLMEELCAISF